MSDSQLRDRILMRLRDRHPHVDAEGRQALAAAVLARIGEYHQNNLAFDKPTILAIHRFTRDARRKADQLKTWLERPTPIGRSRTARYDGDPLERLLWEKGSMAVDLESFRLSLEAIEAQMGLGAHRPPQYALGLLEVLVGDHLADAGITPTAAENGTYVLVLNAVYDHLGIQRSARHRALALVADNPDWKRVTK